MIDFRLLLAMYLPVILLSLMAVLKDRFEPANEALRLQRWSLIPAITIIGLDISYHIYIGLWSKVPILKNYEYNMFNWTIAVLVIVSLILMIIYVSLRHILKVSIVEAFNLKLSYLPFILKLCGVIALIYLSSIYFFGFDPLDEEQRSKLSNIKSMGIKYLLLDSFLGIIIGPFTEEILYRGLLFVPLYRKIGRYGAIIFSSLVFAHLHFTALLPTIYVFIYGILLGWLYDRSGSLLHPLILHMFRNSWIFVALFVTS